MLSDGKPFNWYIVLIFWAVLAAVCLQPSSGVIGQESPDQAWRCDPCPVVSLVSVEPSPVREGETLTVTLRIRQPIPEGSDQPIRGGIIVFDPGNSPYATELIAFVFPGGQETRTISYRVPDKDTPRTIRIVVSPVFDEEPDDFRAGQPSEMTVRVVDEDTAEITPTPPSTASPRPEPSTKPGTLDGA